MAKASRAQQELWAKQQESKIAERNAAADEKRSRAEADRIRAEGEAAAARARADADRIAAQERADAAKAKRDREAKGQSLGERAYQVGSNVGSYAAGGVAGHVGAHFINKQYTKAVQAKAKELNALAAKAEKIMSTPPPKVAPPPKQKAKGKVSKVPAAIATTPKIDPITKARLGGVVSAANKLQLTKVKGPMALPLAGALMAEGIFSRFYMAPNAKTEGEREAFQQIGNASMAAAVAMPVTRHVQNQTLSKIPSATAIQTIETAKRLAGKQAAEKAAGSTVGSLLRSKMFARAGGVGLGIAAVGYALSQTETGKKVASDAMAYVKSFTRRDPETGKNVQVKGHYRHLQTVRREKWRAK